jgi:hypothetical protein
MSAHRTERRTGMSAPPYIAAIGNYGIAGAGRKGYDRLNDASSPSPVRLYVRRVMRRPISFVR